MGSFYFLPLVLLTLRFSFELQSVLRSKEFNKLVDEFEVEDRLKTESDLSQYYKENEEDK